MRPFVSEAVHFLFDTGFVVFGTKSNLPKCLKLIVVFKMSGWLAIYQFHFFVVFLCYHAFQWTHLGCPVSHCHSVCVDSQVILTEVSYSVSCQMSNQQSRKTKFHRQTLVSKSDKALKGEERGNHLKNVNAESSTCDEWTELGMSMAVGCNPAEAWHFFKRRFQRSSGPRGVWLAFTSSLFHTRSQNPQLFDFHNWFHPNIISSLCATRDGQSHNVNV